MHMPAPGRTPLARLHDTARQAGIIVVDAVDDDGPLLDGDTVAFVACGVCIALNPGLDDCLRTDVLAMALALTYAMSPGKTDHVGDITAADGFVLISRTREAEPVSALGLLATVIAHEHGHGTASAAFEYTVPVFELARHTAGSAPLAMAGGALRCPGLRRDDVAAGRAHQRTAQASGYLQTRISMWSAHRAHDTSASTGQPGGCGGPGRPLARHTGAIGGASRRKRAWCNADIAGDPVSTGNVAEPPLASSRIAPGYQFRQMTDWAC
jgi:hypothetical protein